MKKSLSAPSSYIKTPETVTQNLEYREYDRDEIELIIQLVDLMCLGLEDSKLPVS